MDALERLVAENEIRNLVAWLGHMADDGDIDEYLAKWCEDGAWGRGDGTAMSQGHDALRTRILADRANGTQGPGTNSRHINTTLWVEVDSDTEARAQSYFIYLRDASSDAPLVAKTGRYKDQFRKVDGVWKYWRRQIVLDVN